jgi:hypothetical protein
LTHLGLGNVLPESTRADGTPADRESPARRLYRRDGVRPFSVFEGLMPYCSGDELAPAPQRLPV